MCSCARPRTWWCCGQPMCPTCYQAHLWTDPPCPGAERDRAKGQTWFGRMWRVKHGMEPQKVKNPLPGRLIKQISQDHPEAFARPPMVSKHPDDK